MNPIHDINHAIRDHQLEMTPRWEHHSPCRLLHKFFPIFNEAFFKAQPLPLAAFSIEPEHSSRLGSYDPGHSGLGLNHCINLNARHIEALTPLQQLEILAHEMVHLWQQIHGNPGKTSWYHNVEFSRRAAGIGIVSAKGHGNTIKLIEPFISVVRAHGIDDPIPNFSEGSQNAPEQKLVNQTSPLKKWVCNCDPPVSVWSGRKELPILCVTCNSLFRRGDSTFLVKVKNHSTAAMCGR